MNPNQPMTMIPQALHEEMIRALITYAETLQHHARLLEVMNRKLDNLLQGSKQ